MRTRGAPRVHNRPGYQSKTRGAVQRHQNFTMAGVNLLTEASLLEEVNSLKVIVSAWFRPLEEAAAPEGGSSLSCSRISSLHLSTTTLSFTFSHQLGFSLM